MSGSSRPNHLRSKQQIYPRKHVEASPVYAKVRSVVSGMSRPRNDIEYKVEKISRQKFERAQSGDDGQRVTHEYPT